MLTIVRVLKGCIEFLAMLYLAQAILFLLIGSASGQNLVFRFLKRLTGPLDRLVRCVTPARVLDRHLPFVTFFLLALLWTALTAYKIKLVLYDARPGA